MPRKDLLVDLLPFVAEEERRWYQDYRAMRMESWRSVLAELQALPKGRLLDVGPLCGDSSASAAELGYQVTALDFFHSPPCSVLRQWDIHFERCNLEVDPLPFPNDHFQAILLLEVVEHLHHHLLEPLRELRRVLSPGGRLFVTTPNATCLHNRFRLLRGKSVYHPVSAFMGPPIVHRGLPFRDLHAREYTLEELRQVLRASGFQVLRASYHSSRQWKPALYRRACHMFSVLRDLIPPFRKSLFAVATKSAE